MCFRGPWWSANTSFLSKMNCKFENKLKPNLNRNGGFNTLMSVLNNFNYFIFEQTSLSSLRLWKFPTFSQRSTFFQWKITRSNVIFDTENLKTILEWVWSTFLTVFKEIKILTTILLFCKLSRTRPNKLKFGDEITS